jgi:GntR family transcriptional regulator
MKKYEIVRRFLLEKIKSLYPDDRIPSERELVATLQVSRMTVRKALEQLVEEGYLYREANAGTFVSGAGLRRYSDPLFSHRLAGEETNERRDIHHVRLIKAPEDVANGLHLSKGAWALQFQMTTYDDALPIAFEEFYYNADIVGDVDYELFRLIGLRYINERLGMDIASSTKQFKAVLPVPMVQHRLQLSPQQPIIYQTATTRLKDGRIVEYYKGYINDRFKPVILMTRV